MFSITAGGIDTRSFLFCTGISLLLGIAGAGLFMYKNTYSSGMVITLSVMPAVIQLVIMMVNGSIGSGVAVAGAFSLVRFRSRPGSAREMTSLFISVAVGIASGTGFVAAALVFFAIIAVFIIILTNVHFGDTASAKRDLRIMLSENASFDSLFDDIFKKYTKSCELVRVRSTNTATLYDLRYRVTLRDISQLKEFIDALQEKSGSITVTCGLDGTNELL